MMVDLYCKKSGIHVSASVCHEKYGATIAIGPQPADCQIPKRAHGAEHPPAFTAPERFNSSSKMGTLAEEVLPVRAMFEGNFSFGSPSRVRTASRMRMLA